MASRFMSRETGLGMLHSDLLIEEILDKVNKSRYGKQYPLTTHVLNFKYRNDQKFKKS